MNVEQLNQDRLLLSAEIITKHPSGLGTMSRLTVQMRITLFYCFSGKTALHHTLVFLGDRWC